MCKLGLLVRKGYIWYSVYTTGTKASCLSLNIFIGNSQSSKEINFIFCQHCQKILTICWSKIWCAALGFFCWPNIYWALEWTLRSNGNEWLNSGTGGAGTGNTRRNLVKKLMWLAGMNSEGGQKKNTQEKGKSGSYSDGLFATPWCVPCQVPPSMGFSRQEHWSRFHFLLQIFPTQGSNPGLPHCRQTLYCLSHQGSPGAKLNKSLIQSSVDGWNCVPSLQFGFSMTEIMATSFKRTYAGAVAFSAPEPTAGQCRPMPTLETPGHSQASLA